VFAGGRWTLGGAKPSYSPQVTSCGSALAEFCLIRTTAIRSSLTILAIWLVFIVPWLASVSTVLNCSRVKDGLRPRYAAGRVALAWAIPAP
jgi:hypothetical protein